MVRGITRLAAAGAFFLAGLAAGWAQSGPPQGLRPVKLMIISMFRFEAEPWIKNLHLNEEVPIPGLSADYPNVRCNADGVCQMTTGMGHANAAASTMALIMSQRLDLRKAYILIAGIAGINPELGTIGSATWARHLVDFGLQSIANLYLAAAPWVNDLVSHWER